jgi:hypothetical protein
LDDRRCGHPSGQISVLDLNGFLRVGSIAEPKALAGSYASVRSEGQLVLSPDDKTLLMLNYDGVTVVPVGGS